MTGYLRYNNATERPAICNAMGEWINDGLHCGEAIKAYAGDRWIESRIEFDWKNQEWYIPGAGSREISGIPVAQFL